jgi:hypothetical protein
MNDKLTAMFKAAEKGMGKYNVVLSRTGQFPEPAQPTSQNRVFGNHPSVVYEVSKTLWASSKKQPQSLDDKVEGGKMQDLFKTYGINEPTKQRDSVNTKSLLGGERGIQRMKDGLDEELEMPLVVHFGATGNFVKKVMKNFWE